MPNKALHFCNHTCCNQLTNQRYCPVHMAEYEERRKQEDARYDKTRQSSNERGYNARWQKARTTFLMHHPLCAECEREDRLTPATVVDHVKAHKGDQTLFWDVSNWQPLCKRHHDIKTAREDGRYGL